MDEYKPLLLGRVIYAARSVSDHGQGLTTLANFTAQHEDLRVTSLVVELNLSTFGTHPGVVWVIWGRE